MRGFGLSQTKQLGGEWLLVSCSAKKRKSDKPLPARQLYTGNLIRWALRYAERFGYRPLILSAKYGWVEPGRFLPWYDQKLQVTYDGNWPDGEGVFVGSSLYFGNAPERFKRLVPEGLPIGKQVEWLRNQVIKANRK